MTEWWMAPEWGKPNIMQFPQGGDGRVRRVRDDTDPVLERNKRGGLVLRLVPARDEKGQMRPPVRIFSSLP